MAVRKLPDLERSCLYDLKGFISFRQGIFVPFSRSLGTTWAQAYYQEVVFWCEYFGQFPAQSFYFPFAEAASEEAILQAGAVAGEGFCCTA